MNWKIVRIDTTKTKFFIILEKMGIRPMLIVLIAMNLWELKKGARTALNPHEISTGHTKKDDWTDEQMSMLDITNKISERFHLQVQQFCQHQGMVCSTINDQRVCSYDLKEESCIDQQNSCKVTPGSTSLSLKYANQLQQPYTAWSEGWRAC